MHESIMGYNLQLIIIKRLIDYAHTATTLLSPNSSAANNELHSVHEIFFTAA